MDISDWVYRGEGNSSLVITNTKNNKVYKLRKKKNVLADCNNVSKTSEGSLQMCSRMLQYSECVLRPLLGEKFVPIAEIVPISKDFIKSISEKVSKLRPAKRLSTEIDEDSSYGICLPDLCFIHPSNSKNSNPVFCIEIKPKMGFLPKSKLISEERSIKTSACKFCMYQKLKVENRTWDSASLYCPLDLFSGNKERMIYALSCLIKTPQNNLRIFMNGQLIFSNNGRHEPTSQDHQRLIELLKSQFGSNVTTGEEDPKDLNHSCLRDFLHLIQKVLVVSKKDCERPQPTNQCLASQRHQPTNQCLASHFKPKAAHNKADCSLPSGCILDGILKVQRYDDLDIEGIHPLYQRLQQHLSQHPEDSEKYCLEGPFSQLFIEQLPMMIQLPRERSYCSTEYTLDDGVQKIRQFLIAATSKDCSIMVTMQQTSTHMDDLTACISSSNGNRFAYQCNIVDLDPKPSTRIPMYNQLDHDITQYYKKYCDCMKGVLS